jgi:hypothetical protein
MPKFTASPQFTPDKLKVEYVRFMSVQGRQSSTVANYRRPPAHDEFSGAGKVSHLDEPYEDQD